MKKEIKIVPMDLKKMSVLMDEQVVKNTNFSTLKTKVNRLDKNISNPTTLIRIINTKQINRIWRKNLEMLIKKIPDASGLVTTAVLNTTTSEVGNKIPVLVV